MVDKYLYTFLYITRLYEGWQKGSETNQDTLMECDQIRFIFQNGLPYGPQITSIGVAVLGFH